MNKNIRQFIVIVPFIVIFSVISCVRTTSQATGTANVQVLIPSITNSPTPSTTPTLDPQVLAVFRATLWATERPLPTEPIGYPSPQPPHLDPLSPDEQHTYGDEIWFMGNYVVRSWIDFFSSPIQKTVTISALGQTQAEVTDVHVYISELSGVDITGDGKPELILYTHNDGNNSEYCTYIYSLGSELKPILYRVYNYNRKDYFKDLNNDGIYEYISLSTLPASLSPVYYSYHPITVWEYQHDAGYVNASSKYQSLYADVLKTTQSEIDTAIRKGQDPDTYVYYLAMNYFYSGQDEKAWAVLEKYLPLDKVKFAGQTLIALRDDAQIQHPVP